MVKEILIKIIKIYQKTPTMAHHCCKFIPTCSNYAIAVIDEFGIFKGCYLALKRILKCNPLNKGGIDLPPKHKKN